MHASAPALALALALSACGGEGGGGGGPSDSGADPAVAALRACVERSPHELCPRPTVAGDAGPVLVDSTYWADALARRPAVFHDAAEACTRASLAQSAVGMARGVGQADRALAQAKVAGTAPRDARLDDPGVCYDVYLVHSQAGPGHESLGARLGPPETARLAVEGRAARDRRNMELFLDRPTRSYDSL